MDILKSAGFLDILKYTDFWISKNELWTSKNQIIDILNSVLFLDIQKCILGHPKIHWLFGYPKIELWISKIQHDFWISKNVFLCIFGYPKMNYGKKSICGYPKIHFWISKHFWISIIILWYPKFIFGYPKMNYGYPKMNYGYPKMNFWYPYIGNRAPGLGQKSLVTKTTWCRKIGKSLTMSHFCLVVSALSPDGRSIWPNKKSRFCHESFRLVSVGVGWSSLGYGTEEDDREEWNSM